jgi:hypothetical protein
MGNGLNPDAEMERLASFHEQIARLREKLRVLKEKESDAVGDSPPSAKHPSTDGKQE